MNWARKIISLVFGIVPLGFDYIIIFVVSLYSFLKIIDVDDIVWLAFILRCFMFNWSLLGVSLRFVFSLCLILPSLRWLFLMALQFLSINPELLLLDIINRFLRPTIFISGLWRHFAWFGFQMGSFFIARAQHILYNIFLRLNTIELVWKLLLAEIISILYFLVVNSFNEAWLKRFSGLIISVQASHLSSWFSVTALLINFVLDQRWFYLIKMGRFDLIMILLIIKII